MSAKGFRFSTGVIAVILGAVLIWSILAELALWVPFAALGAATALKYLARKRTTDTLADERQVMLGNRAGGITFRILAVVMALTGFVFIQLKESLPADFQIIGVTLAFTASAMLIVYIVSYIYLYARS